ncbi:MAG: hypothetical protein ACE147_13355 [Candidatus Methylomirabilales bacterium]
MRGLCLLAMIALAAPAAAAQPVGPGVTVATPPRPMATIEFVQEAGIERWQVQLTGSNFSVGKAFLRFSGLSCTHMDEVYRGMITPLYDDMTFKTRNGKICTVQAIER